MTDDDVLRGEVIQQLMCEGAVAKSRFERRYDIDFDDYFSDALARLQPLAAEGLVTLQADAIRVTSRTPCPASPIDSVGRSRSRPATRLAATCGT